MYVHTFQVHWAAALLLSAGMRDDLSELVRIYNALQLDHGRDRLPEDEAGRMRMCQCRSVLGAPLFVVQVETFSDDSFAGTGRTRPAACACVSASQRSA